MRHVNDPLAIAREIGLAGRYARKVDGELSRFTIHADQIETELLSDDEQILSIRTRRGITEHKRAHRQLAGLSTCFAKPRGAVAQRPDVLGVVACGFEQKVLSIGSPGSSKFLGGLVPSRQDRA